MVKNDELMSVEKVAITVVVDNKADLIVKSSDHVKYFTDEPLLAEHGFCAVIQVDDSPQKILWDAGVSEVAVMENIRRMKLDLTSITVIALSHGHLDHYAGMNVVLKAMKRTPEPKAWGKSVSLDNLKTWQMNHQIPLVAHPAAFRERWWKKEDGTLVGPNSPPPVSAWEAAGARILATSNPYQLMPGCWTTGYVPRISFEKSGRPTRGFYREGADFIPDDLEEDQAVVINVKDKGLVVLSGCAHSGIVNTVKHAQAFTGVEHVCAIIGGFHLARATDEEIKATIDFFKQLEPTYVVPSHCTGFRAISQFAREMPREFIEGVVGATYIF